MKITILTLFCDVYYEYLNSSIIKRAINDKHIEIEVIDFRQFSLNKHKKVDDYQYGGGAGMVLQLQPIVDAIKKKKESNSYIVLTSPSGNTLTQKKLIDLSKMEHIILIAGHYEGFDARIENYIDESISIGDYVLTGGELPSLVIVDGLVRLIPGVINQQSLISESFNDNLLDYPVYTSPVNFENHIVPDVLLSGNHQAIKMFNDSERIRITKEKRPDLYKKYLERNKHEN